MIATLPLTCDSRARGNHSSSRGLRRHASARHASARHVLAKPDLERPHRARYDEAACRKAPAPAFGDVPMKAGFGRIGMGSFVKNGENLPRRSGSGTGIWFKRGLLWLMA